MKFILRIAVTGSTREELIANAHKVLDEEVAKDKVQYPRLLAGKREIANCIGHLASGEDFDWDMGKIPEDQFASLCAEW